MAGIGNAQTGVSLTKADSATQTRMESAYGKLPMQFEANSGQVASEVKFVSRGSGFTLFLTPTEAVLSLRQRGKENEAATPSTGLSEKRLPLRQRFDAAQAGKGEGAGRAQAAVVRMRLVGANPRAQIAGTEELPGKVNYFIGNDPKKWRTNVITYQKVNYQSVYPGVDLVYYGNQRQLEYDFVISPHADPRLIRLRFEGTQRVRIDESGALVLKTTSGEEIRQHKPLVYQEVDGKRREIVSNYVRRNLHEIGFEIAEYDQTRSLVIDPTLMYSTYLGGGSEDRALSVAVDSAGNAYVTGLTRSTNFPTANALQTGSGGQYDAFVTKLNAAGNALVYSTYLGGSVDDIPYGIAVDSTGNAYVAGYTQSNNFPLANAIQPTQAGNRDVFVTKLNAAGSALVYSTYLGGASNEEANSIAVDSTGSAYIAGDTFSTDFPTASALQPGKNGGQEAFLTKLNLTGTALVYSTYLGGVNNDVAYAIAVDSNGNAYVAGDTRSTNFPTFNAIQPVFGGGGDAFVTKVNAVGSGLVYSTYLGGSNGDTGTSIAVDTTNNAYITGYTNSGNFPTANAMQPVHAGGVYDAFVTKLNAAGNQLVYSTFLGGSDFDVANAIAVDASGNAYVGGKTVSPDFPTKNAPQTILADGYDAFVAKLNANGSALVYSTYLGGTGWEALAGIANNANGTYIVGDTESNDFPVTTGALQVTHARPQNGSDNFYVYKDAFIARIVEGADPTYYAIKGTFTNTNGAPIAGVVIQLSGSQSKTAITSSNGTYIFPFLNPGGSYTVLPESSIPTSQIAIIITSLFNNVTNADFTATQLVVTISGRVTNVNGRGLSGLTVNLSGGATKSVPTDWNGAYAFNVVTGRNYTVAPSDSRVNTTGGWLPSDSISHTNLTQSVTSDNFTANTPTFVVAGVVKNASGTVFPNVPVSLSGGAAATYTTNSSGAYTSDPLHILGDYTFTPQPFTVAGTTYNSFSPANRSFFSILTCNPQTLPPGAQCSGFDYLGMDFVASSVPGFTPAGSNVTVQGSGVEVTFSQVNSAGTTTISSISPASAGTLPGGYVINGTSVAFNISTTAAYTPPVDVCFAMPSVTDATAFSLLALLHNEAGVLVDRTASRDFATKKVCGRVNSLSPFVVASKIVVQFSLASYNKLESGPSTNITVTRTGDTSGPASVNFSTGNNSYVPCNQVNGVAVQNCDFLLSSGTLNFAAGEVSRSFPIIIIEDLYVEGPETISLTLSGPSSAVLGPQSTATLTITDNDSVTPTTNPLDGPQFFVRQHYYDFLGRLPDDAGLAFWTNEITQCGTNQACINERRVAVSNAFFFEQEYQQTASYVFLLYRAAYGNDQPFPNPDFFDANVSAPLKVEAKKLPRYLSFVRDRAQVVGGSNLAQTQLALANAFVQRPEFTAKYPTSLSTGTQFVNALLATIQSASGVNLSSQTGALVTHFNNGGRGLVMFHLANDYWNGCERLPGSPTAPCVPAGFGAPVDNRPFIDAEYTRSFVYSQYTGYLRRDGDIGGFMFWLTEVNKSPPRNVPRQRAMVCSFMTSTEYQQRLSPIATHNNSECPPPP